MLRLSCAFLWVQMIYIYMNRLTGASCLHFLLCVPTAGFINLKYLQSQMNASIATAVADGTVVEYSTHVLSIADIALCLR